MLAAVATLRMRGLTVHEIAKELDCSARTVARYIAEAKIEVAMSEPMRRLKTIAVPLAVDNLIEGLAERDKDYTLETLKGTGLLVTHSKQDGLGQGPMNLALQVVVEQPPADRLVAPDVVIGNVVGIPRQLTTGESPDAEHEPEAA